MGSNKSFTAETSERYSRALFEVAKEAGELEKIETDIKNFQLILNSSLELQNFTKNPTQNIVTQNSVVDLISKKLNILVIGNNKPTNSKIKKAKELSVSIVSENDWYKFLNI